MRVSTGLVMLFSCLLHGIAICQEQMKIHAPLIELFNPDQVALLTLTNYKECKRLEEKSIDQLLITITDYRAYEIFKKEPIKKNVNYLVIPWRLLVKYKQLDRVPDIRINGGFTICQVPFYERILPILKRIGIDTLFTPHAKKDQVYEGIKVLPFPIYPINGVDPARHKDILYSFIGFENGQSVRREIFQMNVPENCIVIERHKWHYFIEKEQRQKEKEEYQDVLARSRFSLCPRGTGSSSIRFWESLQAGAIPVVIADDLWLPEGVDWDACIIRIAENEIDQINDVIQSISKEQEEAMRAYCLKAHEYFAGSNLVRNIRSYYEC